MLSGRDTDVDDLIEGRIWHDEVFLMCMVYHDPNGLSLQSWCIPTPSLMYILVGVSLDICTFNFLHFHERMYTYVCTF